MAAMAMLVVTPTNSLSSWSASSVPRRAPGRGQGLGQVRLAGARMAGMLGGGAGALGEGVVRLSGGRARRRLVARAAFISPPADPQFLRLDKDGMEEVLGSVPVAPRGPKPIITWSLVAGLLWKQKLRLAVAAMSLVAATTCTLTMPLFSGKFFETLIGVRKEPLGELLAKLGVIYVMEPALTVLFVTNMVHVWENVMANLRSQVFRRILIQKVEFFDRHKVGELTGILSQDLGAIKDLVNENVSRDRGFRAFSEMMGTLVILFVLSSQLAPVLGILMLSISAIVAIYKRTTMQVFKAHGMVQARIIDTASETFSAIRTVRSFGGERRQTGMFDEMVLAYQKSGDKLGWLKSTNESWTRVAIYISLMALYVLGGTKVKAGELAIGTMVSFIGYTFTLTFAVQGFVNTLADLQGMLAAVKRINSVIGRAEVDEWLAHGLEREARGELQSSDECASSVDTGVVGSQNGTAAHSLNYGSKKSVCELAWSGDVVLENVFFAYPLRPEALILKGINLHLKRSTVTAVVGSSGAGKSTIVQLLARFYEPTDGRITLAGIDVRKFDKSEWARAISIVNQEPVLFAMTVSENIAYGLPNKDVSETEIVEAAKAANAHDFIVSLPEGYNTMVGERGSLLSGGQRQRIAIARALLKNAPILILDEATSALDSVSERLVQGALDRLMKGRTTLVIAHRLSTVQAADQIAVCADGSVIEIGTHAELIAKEGVYASLVNTQRLSFE
ncbi:hypothetical protein KC19_5G012700 [Ceratodon purpureus]|uniref:ABC transporter B family member 28 n=1 Tax=Ceratodon purpureus TaxID=3225 RepID=A0A8T0HWV6_CERPU|nr:hypothetical protein KC19_5G012700 [Ceratodon purpureus]